LRKSLWWRLVEQDILLLYIGGLVGTTFPAVSPVADEKLEAERINFHTRLKTDAEIAEIHLVLVRVGQEKTEMASDRKEQIVLKGRKIRQLIDEQLWNSF